MDLSQIDASNNDPFINNVKNIIECYISLQKLVKELKFKNAALEEEIAFLKKNFNNNERHLKLKRRKSNSFTQQNNSMDSLNFSNVSDVLNNAVDKIDFELSTSEQKKQDSFSRSPLKLHQSIVEHKLHKNDLSMNKTNSDLTYDYTNNNNNKDRNKSKVKLSLGSNSSKSLANAQTKVKKEQPDLTNIVNTTIDKENDDETYCEGIIVPSQIAIEKKYSSLKSKVFRQKTITSFHKPTESPFNKNHKSLATKNEKRIESNPNPRNIKLEPMSPIIKNEPNVSTKKDPIMTDSVFAIPNETDEVILIPETENLLNNFNDSAKKNNLKLIIPVNNSNGIECKECIAFLNFVGDTLSDEEKQKRLNECCHRQQKDESLNKTPDGFWVPFFQPTANELETEVDYRFNKK